MPKPRELGIEDLRKLNEWRRYQSTLSFILYVALKKLAPESMLRIEHSMSQGFYCVLSRKLCKGYLKRVEAEMNILIKKNISIKEKTLTRKKAISLFTRLGSKEKVVFLKNIRKQYITVYSLLNHHSIFMMPPYDTTGQVNGFYLRSFAPGFLIIFPTWQNMSKLPVYVPQPRLARIFNEYEGWARILGINDLGQLNYAIKNGRGSEIVKISEALHEKKIAYIADSIVKEKKKLILISGPSSAGKTTFTKRLAIQLLVNGVRPLIISADDYFFPHSQTPKDEFGGLDFESIDAVDIPLLNDHLVSMIKHKKVSVPRFNFHTGRRSRGKDVCLANNEVILLEGIHCLNEKFTGSVSSSVKFKIYVSALTQLNIDNHNRASTTDVRMIRRIVRDTHFRGYNIRGVLQHWGSVRDGEERNIYPFQEEADEMFNSALIYEPAIQKKFCLPILKRIKKDHPEYEEARRLIDFLNLFVGVNERWIPSNSILREFIGGSSFVY
ncbi:MAG: nucleoside kinase [bacterium]